MQCGREIENYFPGGVKRDVSWGPGLMRPLALWDIALPVLPPLLIRPLIAKVHHGNLDLLNKT